jgi:Flp pilus assembly protein TadD
MDELKPGKELLRFRPKELKILSVAGALLTLAYIYMHFFHNGFFYDDLFVIQQNPALHTLKNIPMFFTDVRAHGARPDYQIYYRPFFLLSYAIDYWLGNGISTVVMHVHTFIGFLVMIGLVFLFAKKLFQHITAEPFIPALFAACCFAFHPIVADVINYHMGRDVAFATLYGMLYMVLYLYSPVCRKYYLYLIPLVIGCFFMAPAMMFMPVLWLYIIFFEKDKSLNGIFGSIKQTWKPMLPGMITAILAAGIVFLKSKPEMASSVDRFTYMLTQPHVILNFFNPENLNPNAWRDFVTSVRDYHFIIGSLFVVMLITAIYLLSLKKNLRPVSFGLAWFIFCILPTHSILPLFIAQNDYHMFPSVIGLSIALCGTVLVVLNHFGTLSKLVKPLVVAGCLLFLVVMAYGSRGRVRVWSSDKAMWLDVIKKEPTNGRVLMNLGVDYMSEGNMNLAEQYFEQAKVYYPAYDLVYVNLGIVKNMLRDTATANTYFKYAVDLHGFDYAVSCFFYARFLHGLGHDDDAITLLNIAVKENSGYTEARDLLMDIYNSRHDKQLATVCREALRLEPDNTYAANYLKLYMSDSTAYTNGGKINPPANPATAEENNYIAQSLQFFNQGQFQKCIDMCRKVIELDPNSAIAYNNICAAANNLKHWDEAIEAGRMALKLQPDFALAKNNLSFALSQKEKGVR